MSRESEIAKYSTAYQHPEYRMGDARRQALTSWLTTHRGVDRTYLDRTYLDVGCGRGASTISLAALMVPAVTSNSLL